MQIFGTTLAELQPNRNDALSWQVHESEASLPQQQQNKVNPKSLEPDRPLATLARR